MTWGIVAGAVVGGVGSMYAADKNADAQRDAAEMARELPEWAAPYVTGSGQQPSYMTDPVMVNSEWLDYITALGQGDFDAEWAPMHQNNVFFHPEEQFTPSAPSPGMPYGTLPEGLLNPTPEEPPPEQTGMNLGPGYDVGQGLAGQIPGLTSTQFQDVTNMFGEGVVGGGRNGQPQGLLQDTNGMFYLAGER